MQDYLDLGHMSIADPLVNKNYGYYVPHHGVLKQDSISTKLRVVFNASAKSGNGISLNDTLLVGPKLQTNIVTILLRFRLHKYVIIADIKQMYRQIILQDKQRDFQRLLWRFDANQSVQEYTMNRVMFGVSSSPFLALRTIRQLSIDEKAHFLKAAEVLQSDVYVDDVITGCNSIEETRCLAFDLISLLKKGGSELKKFVINEPSVLTSLPTSTQQSIFFDKEEPSIIKILGLQWQPQNDNFYYNINCYSTVCTKRTLLSEVARIFDPLGFLSPLVVFAKHLIQKLWMLKLDWDDTAPPDITDAWKSYQFELPLLKQIAIPRVLPINKSTICEMHGFCDSSEIAFAALIYFRTIQSTGEINTTLICSKTKLAPLKNLSIPRLELCAAVLLSKLISFVKIAFVNKISFSKIIAWSDSKVVLSWIKAPSYKWKTFVANRVSIIHELLPGDHWKHVVSADNPADCASRGLLPSKFLNNLLWWIGPIWLKLDAKNWPCQIEHWDTNEEIKQKTCLLTGFDDNFVEIIDRYSSLLKLQRIICICVRFSLYCRRNRSLSGVITTKELSNSLLILIRVIQQIEFSSEIEHIRMGKICSNSIRKLNPFLDSEKILRVRGRLRNSSLNYKAKYPVLLPKKGNLTKLIITHFHNIYLHPGRSTLLAILRRQFWILSPHRVIKSVLANCYKCFRFKPSTFSPPILGDLPSERVSEIKAFKIVGVDFGGPFSITMNRLRGAKIVKAYLCLFVCFSTKAVHLELASDLSAETFLAAFRRFMARRGKCVHVYSDCGTNFVGSNKILMQYLQTAVEKENLKWSFHPPASPHMGGLWEAGIKSVKTHLTKIIGNQIFTFEELLTVYTQIESLLNSRPLCAISSDPNDLQAITPNHFLTIEPLGSFYEDDVSDLNIFHLSRWQRVQALHQNFWKRWSREYLNTLQQRNGWGKKNTLIEIGILVLIKNELCSPLRWKLGRIIALHPGSDNIVRAVSVQTASGICKRPIIKLCPLPNQ